MSVISEAIKAIKTNLKDIILGVVIIGTALFSYFYFQTYRPKSLKQLRETSSFESTETSAAAFKLPQMKGSKEVGSSNTNKGKQITLEVTRKPSEVQSFYKNVFLDRGWKLSEQTESKEFLIDIYEKENQQAKLTISKDTSKPTVVGINFSEE